MIDVIWFWFVEMKNMNYVRKSQIDERCGSAFGDKIESMVVYNFKSKFSI